MSHAVSTSALRSSFVGPARQEAGSVTHTSLPEARHQRAQLTTTLFRSAHHTADPEERGRLLERIVRLNMPIAQALARSYEGRGVGEDDLEQVAYLGLVYAAQHFDVTLDREFRTYAVPTIRGHLRKHFRDQGWTIRPPRRVQEMQASIRRAREELSQALGRSPRPSELAAHLDAEAEDVDEALACDGCFTPVSLDKTVGEGTATLGDLLGSFDDSTTSGDQLVVEARLVLSPLIRRLSDRDRRILAMRFLGQHTQQEIGDELGITQMQVSRILSRILGELRRGLSAASAAEDKERGAQLSLVEEA